MEAGLWEGPRGVSGCLCDLSMCLPWALLLVGAPGSCFGRWRRGLYGWAPVCSPLRSTVNTVPGSQGESFMEPVSCLWCFSDLREPPSTHTPTSLCTDLHRGRRRLSICQSSIHTAQSRAPKGSCFPTASPSSGVIVSGPQVTMCPPTCSCPEGKTPLKFHFPSHGHEGTWRCPGRAPVAARPGVASSSLTGITLGALLVKDQRHPG